MKPKTTHTPDLHTRSQTRSPHPNPSPPPRFLPILGTPFLRFSALVPLTLPLTSCRPPHYDVLTPEIQQHIYSVWNAAKVDADRLEADSIETDSPLRETLNPEDFLRRYPNLTPGRGPTEKHYAIPHPIEPIPFLIITGSTPKNLQRHKRYAYCSLVLPPEIASPHQFSHPDTLETKIQTGITNAECPVADTPVLKTLPPPHSTPTP